jgi:hypothetical protein
VKVAIYNNGVEKANIVFNAIGANKDSWFDKSRIISNEIKQGLEPKIQKQTSTKKFLIYI